MPNKTQRIRDPIHGLINFEGTDKVDMTAWKLIRTPEFQRLRRIKQLGVSEFVFPGATHTRFAHSIGVYHNARKLMRIINLSMKDAFDQERSKTVLLAALLHDVGHGPFSHAFEGARYEIGRERGEVVKNHEKFSALLITAEDGSICKILGTYAAKQIAQLLEADEPTDFYHAVVSSSFDADRLDYLVRDRYMTGTQSGTIDEEWLLDNLITENVTSWQDGDDVDSVQIPTFVFKNKARYAVEDFLLARFRLYHQVYMHKTTRGFERLLSALLKHIGNRADSPAILGLSPDVPLLKFLSPKGETLTNYRRLDDTSIWTVIEQLTHSSDYFAKKLACRIWNREPLKIIDVSAKYQNDPVEFGNALKHLQNFKTENRDIVMFEDQASFDLYSESNEENGKVHKMVRVKDPDGHQKEIFEFGDTIISKRLQKKIMLTRYYFLESDDRTSAEKAMIGG